MARHNTERIPASHAVGNSKAYAIKKYLHMLKIQSRIITDTERTHEYMYFLLGSHSTPYYRFNVQKGLEKMRLDDYGEKKRKLPRQDLDRGDAFAPQPMESVTFGQNPNDSPPERQKSFRLTKRSSSFEILGTMQYLERVTEAYLRGQETIIRDMSPGVNVNDNVHACAKRHWRTLGL
ncbi:hypothetical protein BDY21DRAFT_363820 [Lineolata rhizophorae]|uniref:Uncharacterized protein n=1 Tax=Lineolata rhizophorae TaxID=578093 RepID=A0A6A6P0M8_9PEZI|nr:hypothetical protein BDY21DRAFT_363820 [Lineolata rhizophorae]